MAGSCYLVICRHCDSKDGVVGTVVVNVVFQLLTTTGDPCTPEDLLVQGRHRIDGENVGQPSTLTSVKVVTH